MGNEWAVGFWGVGFHFQRRVGAFWLAFLVSGRGFSTGKKRKAFLLFQHKGFQHRGGGWFLLWGVPASKKNFSSARTSRGWWCSSGVTGWLCKGRGGPADRAFSARGQGRFQRGCWEGFDEEEELFQRSGFPRGVGVSPKGNNHNGGKKLNQIVRTEPSNSSGSPVGPPV